MTHRSIPWGRGFTSTATTKNNIQALAYCQWLLNTSAALPVLQQKRTE